MVVVSVVGHHGLLTGATAIYETEQTQLGVFLETTRSILQGMVGIAQDMEQTIHANFQSSVDAMSKETRHVTLLYHQVGGPRRPGRAILAMGTAGASYSLTPIFTQCVIVATRPLLLSLLKERLDKLDHGEGDWQGFLNLTKPLISTSIKSAIKTLQVLSSEDGLLGTSHLPLPSLKHQR